MVSENWFEIFGFNAQIFGSVVSSSSNYSCEVASDKGSRGQIMNVNLHFASKYVEH